MVPFENPRLARSRSPAAFSTGFSASVAMSSAISATSLTAVKLGPIHGTNPKAFQTGSEVRSWADPAWWAMRWETVAAFSRSPSPIAFFS